MACNNSLKTPFFSIIVPVYNVENYLDRCIKSIAEQDFVDYEVVLVDDGSTDASASICDNIASRDSRFLVIHKENGGQSTARNLGLQKASGIYVLYIDSDDELIRGSLRKIYNHIKKIRYFDVLQGRVSVVEDQTQKQLSESEVFEFDNIINGKEYLKRTLNHTFIAAVWPYIYRRDFLLENDLFFMEGVFHEDEEYLPRVMLCATKVTSIDCMHYRYRIRGNSTTTKKDQSQNAKDLLLICNSLQNQYEKVDDVELKRMLNDRIVSMYFTAIYLGKFHKKKDFSIDLDFLKRNAASAGNRMKVLLFSINGNLFYLFEYLILKIRKALFGYRL